MPNKQISLASLIQEPKSTIRDEVLMAKKKVVQLLSILTVERSYGYKYQALMDKFSFLELISDITFHFFQSGTKKILSMKVY